MTLTDTNVNVLNTEKMKSLRIKRGLTMTEAATAAGLGNRQRWYEIESGRQTNVTIDTLNRIAAALGVSAKDLLK